MTKSQINQIHILSNQTINNQVEYQFLYQNLIYTLTLNPNNMFEADKIKLLDTYNNNYNRVIFNPVKTIANDKYLIFKVRFKLNYSPENYTITAVIDITQTNP
jgi:hypothetical protein